MFRSLHLLFLLTMLALPVHADYDAGLSAYRAGDYGTALKEFRVLAEKGVTIAQTNMGYMYSLGEGVEQDLEAAAKWFRKAAQGGSSAAQFTMGGLVYHGEGVDPDPLEAYAWFSVAAAGGQQSASDYIALLTAQLSSEELTEARKLSEELYSKYGVRRNVSLGDP